MLNIVTSWAGGTLCITECLIIPVKKKPVFPISRTQDSKMKLLFLIKGSTIVTHSKKLDRKRGRWSVSC